MAETTTQRLDLTKPTPSTGELVSIAKINSNMDRIEDWKIPAAKVRRAAGTQSIPNNTVTAVDFDATAFDTWAAEAEGAMADIAANSITAKINGIYHVELGQCYVTNATGFRALGLAVNGAVAPFQLRYFVAAQTGVPTIVQLSGDIPLTAGDILTAHTHQTSGGALNLDQSGATATDAIYLSATWMGKKP